MLLSGKSRKPTLMPTIAIRDGQVEFYEKNDGVENQTENLWTINGQDGVTADFIILLPVDPVS